MNIDRQRNLNKFLLSWREKKYFFFHVTISSSWINHAPFYKLQDKLRVVLYLCKLSLHWAQSHCQLFNQALSQFCNVSVLFTSRIAPVPLPIHYYLESLDTIFWLVVAKIVKRFCTSL